MLSQLELRQIIESGFLPMKSVCSINPDGMMTVELFHPMKGHAAVIAEGIPVEGLETSRAIAVLVAQLKSELAAVGQADPRMARRRAEVKFGH